MEVRTAVFREFMILFCSKTRLRKVDLFKVNKYIVKKMQLFKSYFIEYILY